MFTLSTEHNNATGNHDEQAHSPGVKENIFKSSRLLH